MMKYIIAYFLFSCLFYSINAQSINMFFPKFEGKEYDFIVFQGTEQVLVTHSRIPNDGKFILKIPEGLSPYKGMARWLITGTKEGGGVDMFIPGKDFSISCLESQPNKNNIVYENNNENNFINDLYEKQISIFNRYALMKQSLKVFNNEDQNYKIFNDEYQKQKKDFEEFNSNLIQKHDYVGQLIQVINITNRIGVKLYDNDLDNFKGIENYISNDINWQYLYTTGYWERVIDLWLNIHTQVLKDINLFSVHFNKIRMKIKADKIYNYFKENIRNKIIEQGNNDYLNKIDIVTPLTNKQ